MGWSAYRNPDGGRVSPLIKLVLLAWLVIGPVGVWLRRRRART